MIGQLIELSAFGRTLKCCQHLKEHVGLVVDYCGESYWIEWVGMDPEDAYPQRWRGRHSFALTNGTWNRRDIRLVKNK
jgi:hypothetical protein